MGNLSKGFCFLSLSLVFIGCLFEGNLMAYDKSDTSQKDVAVWLAIESPPKTWDDGYGDPFPAEDIFKSIKDAGFSDVFLFAHEGRGPMSFYHNTKVQYASRQKMGNREWVEDALNAADKYNINVWLVITPSFKVNGTDIQGLGDPRMIKLWSDIIEEWGKEYKPRHKSLYGIMLHEVDCPEAVDPHSNDSDKFSAFCEKNYGEKYSGEKMPDGKSGTKWDKRFYLYKNYVVNNFTTVMKNSSEKYGMKTAFCLYHPEQFNANSALWGYDTLSLEKIVDRIWVLDYNDLKGAWREISLSYSGVDIPYNEMSAFHGKPTSVFECRGMLYPEVLRKALKKHKPFTSVYGKDADYYAVTGKSQKVIDLFIGVENVKKWNDLQSSWTGATSQDKIALLSSSVPFTLRYPDAPGVRFRKVFTNLKNGLKKYYPVNTLLIGSEFTLNPENLRKYDILILPEEMGIGLDKVFLESLLQYMKKGGKLLTIGTPLTVSNSDLTIQKDCTEDILGIKINSLTPKTTTLSLSNTKLSSPEVKIKSECRDISVIASDEIILKDNVTGKPVMSRKGNAYYMAFSYPEGNEKFFAELLEKISPQPFQLKENTGFIVESVVSNNNMLCVSLPSKDPASAVLSVDTEKIGLNGKAFEVKNIITGKIICTANSQELKKGIPVRTDYNSEPYVLAIGTRNDLAKFKGIYPDNKVFENMGKVNIIENPEVAIMVPDRPGIKVGIYQNALGSEKIYTSLNMLPAFNCFYLPRLDMECMSHADVVIIPQPVADIYYQSAMNEIKKIVSNGKGLLLTHDAATASYKMFPDITGKTSRKIKDKKDNRIKITADHPEVISSNADDGFMPGFAFDHYAFTPGKNAQVIAKDSEGNNVILAGKFEKGRVMVYGTLPGMFCKWDDCANLLKDKKLEGRELQILADSIKWLAGDKK